MLSLNELTGYQAACKFMTVKEEKRESSWWPLTTKKGPAVWETLTRLGKAYFLCGRPHQNLAYAAALHSPNSNKDEPM